MREMRTYLFMNEVMLCIPTMYIHTYSPSAHRFIDHDTFSIVISFLLKVIQILWAYIISRMGSLKRIITWYVWLLFWQFCHPHLVESRNVWCEDFHLRNVHVNCDQIPALFFVSIMHVIILRVRVSSGKKYSSTEGCVTPHAHCTAFIHSWFQSKQIWQSVEFKLEKVFSISSVFDLILNDLRIRCFSHIWDLKNIYLMNIRYRILKETCV